MGREKVKLSKETSRLQFFLGIPFILIGLLMTIGTILTPLPIYFTLFTALWTILASVKTYLGYKSGFTNDGLPLYEIDKSEDRNKKELDFEEKLRKLNSLHRDGLISKEEFEEKRKTLMNEKW